MDYSVLKMKEILSHLMAWMKPMDIHLSKINPSQMDKNCMIPFI